MTQRLSLLFCLMALFIPAQEAGAHTRSESYSHWRQSGHAMTATITMPTREVTRLASFAGPASSAGDVLAEHLRDATEVLQANGRCTQTEARALRAAAGFTTVELLFDCGDATPARVRYRGLFDAAPSHVHYARYYLDGSLTAEFLVTDTQDWWDVPQAGADIEHGFLPFLKLGVQHIAGGIDHIAFLLGLLLVAGALRNSIVAVTGFTLGHSASLAAAVFGYVHADSSLVEAFIGFTVALVAIEYFARRHPQADVIALLATSVAWVAGTVALVLQAIEPLAVVAYLGIGVFGFCYLMLSRLAPANRSVTLLFVATTAFGLIHGLGFAGFLLDTGIAGASLVKPLFGFNIGVELGQLVLVVTALLLARLAGPMIREPLPQIAAAALCGIGVFWFIGRTVGV